MKSQTGSRRSSKVEQTSHVLRFQRRVCSRSLVVSMREGPFPLQMERQVFRTSAGG